MTYGNKITEKLNENPMVTLNYEIIITSGVHLYCQYTVCRSLYKVLEIEKNSAYKLVNTRLIPW